MSKRPRVRGALIVTVAATVSCAAVSVAEAQQPDFTGVWESYRAPQGQGRASGFGGARAGLPLTEEGQRRVEEYRALAGPERLNGAAHCADYGVPTMMSMPGSYPIEFIQKPDQLTIIFEVNNETRRIYIGDRQLPPERRLPSRAGYSEGRWDGDVLVVKTTDLLDGQDQSANPYSEQATIDERFSLEDANGTKVLVYQASITDPVYYTEPIKIERRYQRYDGFIIPYGCQDELWYELLELRREQLEAGKPVDARMSDVYKIREERE
ncbi:MAG TPA: hypothetical protein VLI71_14275 [Gammaproteobacteria bacterium]|nr:hypothetical protein [Gammaproteobacteria bacterium]